MSKKKQNRSKKRQNDLPQMPPMWEDFKDAAGNLPAAQGLTTKELSPARGGLFLRAEFRKSWQQCIQEQKSGEH